MNTGKLNRLLLPANCKIPGIVLIVLGLAALIGRFIMGYKPQWLEIKVFAVYSALFDARYFTVVTNNVAEEVGLLLLVVGLLMLTVSANRIENEKTWSLRIKAMFYSLYSSAIFTVFAILFLYGWGFLAYMAFSLVSFMLFYIIIFGYLTMRNHNKDGELS